MKINLFGINDIDHIRIIKWLNIHCFEDAYYIKKNDRSSSNDYVVDLTDDTNYNSFKNYIKHNGYDFEELKENKMKLTNKEKKLVKEYAKKLQSKKINESDHPGSATIGELDNYLKDILQKNEDLRDIMISLLIEFDDVIGTGDMLYKRLEKLIDKLDVIEKALPNMMEEYKKRIKI